MRLLDCLFLRLKPHEICRFPSRLACLHIFFLQPFAGKQIKSGRHHIEWMSSATMDGATVSLPHAYLGLDGSSVRAVVLRHHAYRRKWSYASVCGILPSSVPARVAPRTTFIFCNDGSRPMRAWLSRRIVLSICPDRVRSRRGSVFPRAIGAYRLADALSALLIYHTCKIFVNKPKKNIFTFCTP